MLQTTLRRVQLSPRSAVSPFICIFCRKKGPNLERRLTTKDVGQSSLVEASLIGGTPAGASEPSESLMSILRKDLQERKESNKGAKRPKPRRVQPGETLKKAQGSKKKKKKKKGSLSKTDAAVTLSPKKKQASERSRCGNPIVGMSIPEAMIELKNTDFKIFDPQSVELAPIEVENQPKVAELSHDLDRVLFNPGIHYLRDPRSGVYNFDPYLQDIMPVTEFDFNAVADYIVSSEDQTLSSMAKKLGKKYVGSTSSMTSVLSRFHFLLSNWRPINIESLSKSFEAEYTTFTQVSREPCAIFLRYKGDGTYAIDPDKEYDTDSILSLLGRSMEKLFTSAPSNYEMKYKKNGPKSADEAPINAPETYHYSTLGDFLMRSQLDSHDSRLPGTGMFDLKTRAVVSVRMDAKNFHLGSGYQIKTRSGTWESFEREYYDMIRAAFLKYSLQVRMGRMDGIFVAFHNTEKIFGFQYVSLDEMDEALHGTQGSGIGDREFKLSLQLLNKALGNATQKFPEKSLRVYFETKEGGKTPMYIFAEPMEEEEIEKIQATNKRDLASFLKILDRQIKSGGEPVSLVENLGDEEGEDENGDDLFEERDGARNAIKEGEDAEDQGDGGDLQKEVAEDDGKDFSESDVESDTESDSDESDIEEAREEEGVRKDTKESIIEGDIRGKDVEKDTKEGVAEGNFVQILREGDLGKIFGDMPEPDAKDEKQEEEEEDKIAVKRLRDIHAQVIHIHNYVNGKHVVRPTRLNENDQWTAMVEMDDIKPATKAQLKYLATRARQRRAVGARLASEDNEHINGYIRKLRNLSKEGRAWAKMQDKAFPGEPVVYKPQ